MKVEILSGTGMVFRLAEVTPRRHVVWGETDHVDLAVGEITHDHGIWKFHYHNAAKHLKDETTKLLVEFATQKILLLTITDRLTK